MGSGAKELMRQWMRFMLCEDKNLGIVIKE
jgi:hypothetical protein